MLYWYYCFLITLSYNINSNTVKIHITVYSFILHTFNLTNKIKPDQYDFFNILLHILLNVVENIENNIKQLFFFFTAFPLAAVSMLATSFLIRKGKV